MIFPSKQLFTLMNTGSMFTKNKNLYSFMPINTWTVHLFVTFLKPIVCVGTYFIFLTKQHISVWQEGFDWFSAIHIWGMFCCVMLVLMVKLQPSEVTTKHREIIYELFSTETKQMAFLLALSVYNLREDLKKKNHSYL